jgi:hypothetical protein
MGAPAVTASGVIAALGSVNTAVIQLMVAAAATTDPDKLQAAAAALA